MLLDDGSVVEVQLDENFEVTGSGVDAEGSGEAGEAGDAGEGGADDGS